MRYRTERLPVRLRRRRTTELTGGVRKRSFFGTSSAAPCWAPGSSPIRPPSWRCPIRPTRMCCD